MKTKVVALTIALLLIPGTAIAAAKQPPSEGTRLLWKERILLRIEGGQCEANGLTAPTYELYVVPTLIRVGGKWVAAENSEVRIPVNEGGVPCA